MLLDHFLHIRSLYTSLLSNVPHYIHSSPNDVFGHDQGDYNGGKDVVGCTTVPVKKHLCGYTYFMVKFNKTSLQ